jgi:hypothetical protein
MVGLYCVKFAFVDLGFCHALAAPPPPPPPPGVTEGGHGAPPLLHLNIAELRGCRELEKEGVGSSGRDCATVRVEPDFIRKISQKVQLIIKKTKKISDESALAQLASVESRRLPVIARHRRPAISTGLGDCCFQRSKELHQRVRVAGEACVVLLGSGCLATPFCDRGSQRVVVLARAQLSRVILWCVTACVCESGSQST